MVEEVIMSEAKFKRAESRNGGWSKQQLVTLGIKWPPKSGWKKKLLGKPMRKDKVDKFIALKDKHLP